MTPLFTYQPHIERKIFTIIWIIPALLIPSAFIIYFGESHNIIQFFSIIGFAIGLAGLLYGLLKIAARIAKGTILEITDSKQLHIVTKQENSMTPLSTVASIQITTSMGLTLLVIVDKVQQKKQVAFSGRMTKEEKEKFKKIIGECGVTVVDTNMAL